MKPSTAPTAVPPDAPTDAPTAAPVASLNPIATSQRISHPTNLEDRQPCTADLQVSGKATEQITNRERALATQSSGGEYQIFGVAAQGGEGRPLKSQLWDHETDESQEKWMGKGGRPEQR